MSVRTAASKVDWTAVTTKLGLNQSTLASLSNFRKRNTDARDKLNVLETQKQDVDFAYYRGLLKNQAIVDEIEKAHKSFKPATYDVSAQIKAIDQFEAKAVENAQTTAKTIDNELSDLQATLQNIEQARPFDDLTVEDVMKARPDIQKNVETMVKKGRWVIPGYVRLNADIFTDNRMTNSDRLLLCRQSNLLSLFVYLLSCLPALCQWSSRQAPPTSLQHQVRCQLSSQQMTRRMIRICPS